MKVVDLRHIVVRGLQSLDRIDLFITINVRVDVGSRETLDAEKQTRTLSRIVAPDAVAHPTNCETKHPHFAPTEKPPASHNPH